MVGKVTPISSLFSAEQTQRASERVQEKIIDLRHHIDVLKGFTSDNSKLINMVNTLPNQLQHQIMVPFGNAAFFPGRLIHTNEFTVLLGDEYYAERTSKQTTDILMRRHKVLESQIESAMTEIQDLKAEASFFDATGVEAKSGLVQIVEDYTEDRPNHEAFSKAELPSSYEVEHGNSGIEDDRIERMFAKLEAEEAAALEAEEAAGDESIERDDDFDDHSNEFSTGKAVRHVKANSLRQPLLVQDVTSQTEAGSLALSKFNTSKNVLEFPESKRSVQDPAAKQEVSGPPLLPNTSGSKACIGSIVEHSNNLDTKQREDTVAASSRPLSRFRMNMK